MIRMIPHRTNYLKTGGTLIIDATCVPSHIRYPQDIALLNEARENAEAMIAEMHELSDGRKHRTYAGRARYLT